MPMDKDPIIRCHWMSHRAIAPSSHTVSSDSERRFRPIRSPFPPYTFAVSALYFRRGTHFLPFVVALGDYG